MQGFLCRLRAGCRNGGRIGLSRQPCCRRPHSVCRGVIRRRCRTDVLRSVRAAGGTDRGTALIDPLLRVLLRFFGLGCRRFRVFLRPLRLFRRREGKPLLRLQQLFGLGLGLLPRLLVSGPVFHHVQAVHFQPFHKPPVHARRDHRRHVLKVCVVVPRVLVLHDQRHVARALGVRQQLLHRNPLRPIQRLKIILVQIPNGREIFVACFFGLLQEFRKLLSCYVDILPSVCYTTNIAARWKGTGT